MSDSIPKEITQDGQSSYKNKQNDSKNKDKTLAKATNRRMNEKSIKTEANSGRRHLNAAKS